MATKSKDTEVKEANRQLRLAVEECRALLKRTDDMLRRSGQDNDRRYSD